jgi:putative nucleotidyltransferase with HDIG domain
MPFFAVLNAQTSDLQRYFLAIESNFIQPGYLLINAELSPKNIIRNGTLDLMGPKFSISFIDSKENDFSKVKSSLPAVDIAENSANNPDHKKGLIHSVKNLFKVKTGTLVAYLVFGSLVFLLLVLYLKRNARRVFENRTKLGFIVQGIIFTSLLLYIASKVDYPAIYGVPFVFVITVISYFFNTRIGLFVHLLNLIFAGLITDFDGEFMTISLIVGLMVVLIFNGNKRWKHVIVRFFGITTCYFVCFALMEMMKSGSMENLNRSYLYWMILNGLITLLAYPLIPVIARFYGFSSDQVLEELSDLNHPLLREMAAKAPGTLQHSIQLSSLAASVAEAINANAQLVKVGALYHDVGKTKYPEGFIENLVGKDNVHDSMNTVESAARIIDHVIEGEKLAKKYHLPEEVTHFILTHHGTSRVEYFYRKHKAAYPNSNLDEKLFRYPGPVPGTKEEAILMLADSLEASARSISNLQASQVDELVDKIIRHKLQDRQLDECGISVKELETCSVVFKNIIKSMHHLRVQYPDEN